MPYQVGHLALSFPSLLPPMLGATLPPPPLVYSSLTEHPVLIHELQNLYLHKLVQSRLFTEESPLLDCYRCLHAFCLALQLDCLHSQVMWRPDCVCRWDSGLAVLFSRHCVSARKCMEALQRWKTMSLAST